MLSVEPAATGATPVATDASIANPAAAHRRDGTRPRPPARDGHRRGQRARRRTPRTSPASTAPVTRRRPGTPAPTAPSTKPFEPALPLISKNVTRRPRRQVLRGVGFRGGTYADLAGIVPLSGAAGDRGQDSAHTAFTLAHVLPGPVARRRTTSTRSAAAADAPARHAGPAPLGRAGHGDLDPAPVQQPRLRALLQQRDAARSPGTSAPSILDVTATADGNGGVDFASTSSAIRPRASRTSGSRYTASAASGRRSTSAPDPSTPTHWTGDAWSSAANDPADLRFIVQAVNGVGLVALDTNDGAFYQIASTPSTPSPTPPRSALGANPTPASFGATVEFAATLAGATPGRRPDRPVHARRQHARRDDQRCGRPRRPSSSTVPGRTPFTAAFAGDAPTTCPSTRARSRSGTRPRRR